MNGAVLLVLTWLMAQPAPASDRKATDANRATVCEAMVIGRDTHGTNWTDRLFSVWPRVVWPTSPTEPLSPFRVTASRSFEALSRRFRFRQRVDAGLPVGAGVFSVHAQAEERSVATNLWVLPEDDATAGVDRGELQVGAVWQDGRKDEIAAWVSYRFDVPEKRQPRETVGVSVKTMLPPPLAPWYLRGELQADSEQAEQASLSLAASQVQVCRGLLLTDLGIVDRQVRRDTRPASDVLTWSMQWRPEAWFGLGVQLRYDLDSHSFESLFNLEMKSRMPGP